MRDPLQDLREALNGPLDITHPGAVEARLDYRRETRTGIPEIVNAQGKDLATILDITHSFVEQNGRAILSRVRPRVMQALHERFTELHIDEWPRARMAVVTGADFQAPVSGGHVGIITAGSADAPVAEEARVISEAMGCKTSLAFDVGVAGLHRLVAPLQRMLTEHADAMIVAAGMDGALPSVVAGLVDIPILGLPTSSGYGAGGKGVGALLTMIQTCVPGLTVVNIDNGVGAGAAAARIANQLATCRRERADPT